MSISGRSAASLALVAALRKFLVGVCAIGAVVFGIAGCVIEFYGWGLAFRGDPVTGLGASVLGAGLLLCVGALVWLADVVRGLFSTGDDWQRQEGALRRAWEGTDR